MIMKNFGEKVKKGAGNLPAIILFLLMAAYFLLVLFLLIWGLSVSLKSVAQFRASPLGFPEGEWHFENYLNAFKTFNVPLQGGRVEIGLLAQYGYSLLYAVGGAFFATLVPCITAYVTAKFPFRFGKIVYAIVVVALGFPIVGALPSQLRLMSLLGLYDSFFGVWLMQASFLGVYFLIFHAAYAGAPKDIAEAAEIDGAGNLRVFLEIALPLSGKLFFTVMLIKFIGFWNDYQTPMLFLPSFPTAAYGMYYFFFDTKTTSAWPTMKIAGAILLLTPVLVVFLLFQKRLVGDLMLGGIKE